MIITRGLRISAILAATIFFCATRLYAQQTEVKAPALSQIGQAFIVEITAPKETADLKIIWQGKESRLIAAPIANRGLYLALLGTDLKNAKPGTHKLVISYELNGARRKTEKNIMLQKRDYPSEKLTVAPKMVNPPKEQMERISRESRLGRKAVQTNTPGFAPKLPLVRPVPGVITSVYGKSRYFNNELRSRHGGVDMRAALGTPVRAAAAGTVVLTGDFWFAGKCVYINHGAGVISFYGHMSELRTGKGSEVKAGEVIGLSGQTGRVTGPHVHFGLSWCGEYVDPEPLMAK